MARCGSLRIQYHGDPAYAIRFNIQFLKKHFHTYVVSWITPALSVQDALGTGIEPAYNPSEHRRYAAISTALPGIIIRSIGQPVRCRSRTNTEIGGTVSPLRYDLTVEPVRPR